MIRTWRFANFSGVLGDPETQKSEAAATVSWYTSSNRIVVEGTFQTGDESYQVHLKEVTDENGELKVKIWANRANGELIYDIVRYVPYRVEVEFSYDFPSKIPSEVTVTHENDDGRTVFEATEQQK